MNPVFSFHARQRMEKRNVSEEDVVHALNRRSGQPAAASPGKIWVFGYAASGRILKVLLATETQTVVTVAWPDEED